MIKVYNSEMHATFLQQVHVPIDEQSTRIINIAYMCTEK